MKMQLDFLPLCKKTILFLLLFVGSPLMAEVRLPAIISDHMVLQKSKQTALWGWAETGEKVRVTLGDKTAETAGDPNGKWHLQLDLSAVDSALGPQKLTIEGKNKIEIADVLIGEVWVTSGQSNMEFPLLESIGAEEEQANHTSPQLREFRVPKLEKDTPQDDCRWDKPWGAKWVVADPKTAGGFSAIGYYFGRQLIDELHVPVGIINAPYAGTPIEAWLSQEALAQDPDLKAGSDKARQAYLDFPSRKDAFVKEAASWIEATGRRDPGSPNPMAFAAEDVSTKDWQSVNLPGTIAGGSLPESGVFWLRREVTVPVDQANKPQKLELGDLSGFDTAYWNGKKLAEFTYDSYPGDGFLRRYMVPPEAVKEGKNIIAVRIYFPFGKPSIIGRDYLRTVGQPLVGPWLAKAEIAFPALPPPAPPMPAALIQRASPQYVASYLYDGMIHPILPYTMRGVLWYQGENNVGRAHQYRQEFSMLIQDWRAKWGEGDFPFYFCQLANFRAKATVPEESNWAELRDAQSQALALPHTGEAVLIDTGESDNIHPRDKRTAGNRLAAIALANDYGKPVPCTGPVYQSMAVDGTAIRLTFSHTDGGLVAKPLPETYVQTSIVRTAPPKTAPLVRNSPDSELEGFAICGADHMWHWAQAKIEGTTVKVWSPQVPVPVAVRYAWANNPTCNLYNGAGFPASPFRTDDFPESTLNAKF